MRWLDRLVGRLASSHLVHISRAEPAETLALSPQISVHAHVGEAAAFLLQHLTLL